MKGLVKNKTETHERCFSPCGCWNLQEGAVTVGLYSFFYAIIQICMLSWQSFEIERRKQWAANYQWSFLELERSQFPNGRQLDNPEYNPNYAHSYWTPLQRFYNGLFIIQIINLIVSVFVLLLSPILIFGVLKGRNNCVWPWMTCMLVGTVLCFSYAFYWIIGGITKYWFALVGVELFFGVVGVYCLFVVFDAFLTIRKNGKLEEFYLEKWGYNRTETKPSTNPQNHPLSTRLQVEQVHTGNGSSHAKTLLVDSKPTTSPSGFPIDLFQNPDQTLDLTTIVDAFSEITQTTPSDKSETSRSSYQFDLSSIRSSSESDGSL